MAKLPRPGATGSNAQATTRAQRAQPQTASGSLIAASATAPPRTCSRNRATWQPPTATKTSSTWPQSRPTTSLATRCGAPFSSRAAPRCRPSCRCAFARRPASGTRSGRTAARRRTTRRPTRRRRRGRTTPPQSSTADPTTWPTSSATTSSLGLQVPTGRPTFSARPWRSAWLK